MARRNPERGSRQRKNDSNAAGDAVSVNGIAADKERGLRSSTRQQTNSGDSLEPRNQALKRKQPQEDSSQRVTKKARLPTDPALKSVLRAVVQSKTQKGRKISSSIVVKKSSAKRSHRYDLRSRHHSVEEPLVSRHEAPNFVFEAAPENDHDGGEDQHIDHAQPRTSRKRKRAELLESEEAPPVKKRSAQTSEPDGAPKNEGAAKGHSEDRQMTDVAGHSAKDIDTSLGSRSDKDDLASKIKEQEVLFDQLRAEQVAEREAYKSECSRLIAENQSLKDELQQAAEQLQHTTEQLRKARKNVDILEQTRLDLIDEKDQMLEKLLRNTETQLDETKQPALDEKALRDALKKFSKNVSIWVADHMNCEDAQDWLQRLQSMSDPRLQEQWVKFAALKDGIPILLQADAQHMGTLTDRCRRFARGWLNSFIYDNFFSDPLSFLGHSAIGGNEAEVLPDQQSWPAGVFDSSKNADGGVHGPGDEFRALLLARLYPFLSQNLSAIQAKAPAPVASFVKSKLKAVGLQRAENFCEMTRRLLRDPQAALDSLVKIMETAGELMFHVGIRRRSIDCRAQPLVNTPFEENDGRYEEHAGVILPVSSQGKKIIMVTRPPLIYAYRCLITQENFPYALHKAEVLVEVQPEDVPQSTAYCTNPEPQEFTFDWQR